MRVILERAGWETQAPGLVLSETAEERWPSCTRGWVPLAVEQVLALEAAMPARWRAMVPLGAAAGPRVSEALGLPVDRTGLKPPSAKPTMRIDRQLVVRRGEPPYLGPPKPKASRRDVPVPRVLVEALAAHLTAFPPVPREMRWSVATRPAGPGPRSCSSCSRPRGASR